MAKVGGQKTQGGYPSDAKGSSSGPQKTQQPHVVLCLKTMGARVQGCSSVSFSAKAAEQIPAEVRETLEPLLRLIQTLSEEIKSYEKRIEKLGSEKYMDTKLLRQVNGVGPVTSLAYVLTLETP
ncbi:MAG TPA: hypothetical protein VGI45_03620 [Terracidiphilus sp.]